MNYIKINLTHMIFEVGLLSGKIEVITELFIWFLGWGHFVTVLQGSLLSGQPGVTLEDQNHPAVDLVGRSEIRPTDEYYRQQHYERCFLYVITHSHP